jgi:hypothetical protein
VEADHLIGEMIRIRDAAANRSDPTDSTTHGGLSALDLVALHLRVYERRQLEAL